MDEPHILWQPSPTVIENSNLFHFREWLKEHKELDFKGYSELWEWSVRDISSFWEAVWQYFDILSYTPYQQAVSKDPMPMTRWFEGSTLNYAEHIFRNFSDLYPAIKYRSEFSELKELSWNELRDKVGRFRNFLIGKGVKQGDRVVAYLPNIPEANIAFLAVNSLGAIWSSSSPDFGTSSVIDRFAQIEPKVLIAVNGYQYGGKVFDKSTVVQEIHEAISSLEMLVYIDYHPAISSIPDVKGINFWSDALDTDYTDLEFEAVPFNHPIWVLYSSGTTGKPKAITHSHGGILLEHLKYIAFHNDVKQGENCFWFTTTGWMMWNYIQASLLCGGTVVLYDGSPAFPNLNILWDLAEDAEIHHFGTSAGYVVANMKENINPGKTHNLSNLRSIGSTGSPLPPEGFEWIYQEIKNDLWLTSISGGTDVCSAFVGGVPFWPVYSGEIQCRALGCDLVALNEQGEEVLDEVGEMVIKKPMPSMPIFFWNDENNERYLDSYFNMYPEMWRHGDWIKLTPRHGIIIYGRSDSTLNRGGVRIGTSEIYSAVDKVEEVKDSLIICIEVEGGNFYMPLFVVLQEGIILDKTLISKINSTIRNAYSPRHVPDEIIEVRDIPYTISGKKIETPVKKILMGMDPEKIMNKDALRNPESLEFFKNIKKQK